MDRILLSNLAYSLNREVLCVGDNGCYASTSVVGCHTRKYHGLYVCPQPNISEDRYVLLSHLQETISQQGCDFRIGVTRYGEDLYDPKGHKYLQKFELSPHPTWWYRVGGVLLKKEMLMHRSKNRLILKYTLEEAHSETTLSLKPFCSFRNMHSLTHRNEKAENKLSVLKDGIKIQMYSNFSELYIQAQETVEFTEQRDWYLNIEYMQEKERGYDYKEDWFTPGALLYTLKKGEPLYIGVSTEALKPTEKLSSLYEEAVKSNLPANSLSNCLLNAADDFLIHISGRTQIIAGFPWFGSWGRDTFISLPGLCMTNAKFKEAEAVLDSMLQDKQGILFPNVGWGNAAAYNSVDAPLWFIWAVQQLYQYVSDKKRIWAKYGQTIRDIIEGYASGQHKGIYRNEQGLIFASVPGSALTWMDALVRERAVTPRSGAPVEINALWYNNVCFALEAGEASSEPADKTFRAFWKEAIESFPAQFKAAYWDKKYGYLADVITEDGTKDFSFRSNQIIAVALPYKPLSDKICQLVTDLVKQELLTPRGLRTLSPRDSRYEGIYEGDQNKRDSTYHQGIVWVWQLEHFARAYYDVYGQQAIPLLRKIWEDFEAATSELCMGSIAEIYDANPPHKARGAISQAWSVGALLRIKELLKI